MAPGYDLYGGEDPIYISPVPTVITVDPSKPSDDGRKESEDSGYSGNPYYVVVYIRQVKPSAAGKVKYQVQAYFYYAPYNQTCGATLRVYRGTDSSGQQVFFNTWDWQRDGSSGWHTYFSPWFDIAEFDNTSTLNLFAVCQPSIRAQVTYHNFTLYPKRSYTLTRVLNNHLERLTYSIQDHSSINGGHRLSQVNPTEIIYEGDGYYWSAEPANGYKVEPSYGTGEVTGDMVIAPTATAMATMHVKESAGWGMYSTYVRQNGVWLPHQVNVRQNGTWETYT